MPPGYPPKPAPNCLIVSCFLTPSAGRPSTYPAELKEAAKPRAVLFRI